MNRTLILRSVRTIQNARQPCNKLGSLHQVRRVLGKHSHSHSYSFTSQVQHGAINHPLGCGRHVHGLRVPPLPASVSASASSNQFSSAATAPSLSEESEESESSPRAKTKKRIQKKNPIIVTEKAAERIKELLSSPNGKNSLGIRLGVKRRGCNGLSYTLNYAMERQAHEEELTAHGVTVFIEPMALFSVIGTVMDYEITDMSTEFTFQNPNSKGECGCGESFNV